MNDTTYSNRVWRGDPKTVAEARATYEAEPSLTNLIAFAVALYSKRHRKRFAQELMDLRDTYKEQAWEFANPTLDYPHMSPNAVANAAETMAAHFLWMSRQPDIELFERMRTRELVRELVAAGSGLIRDPTNHTPYLLSLTSADLDLEQGTTTAALDTIRRCARNAHQIAKPNQRTRAYRKLGLLYRKLGAWLTGFWWSFRACVVPGVPLAVRAKSVAAFFGIER